jgi:hypothetical protein
MATPSKASQGKVQAAVTPASAANAPAVPQGGATTQQGTNGAPTGTVVSPLQQAQALVKQYLAALQAPQYNVAGYNVFTGQKPTSAGHSTVLALHIAQGNRQVAIHLLVLTAYSVPGTFTCKQGPAAVAGAALGSVSVWAGPGLQVWHGYTVGANGVARVQWQGKPTVHPSLYQGQGVLYGPHMHALHAQVNTQAGCGKHCNRNVFTGAQPVWATAA